MKRDARIGLAVVLVLGLSITLLVARSIHQHGAEAGIGDEPVPEPEAAVVDDTRETETAATIDPAYEAHARAVLAFQEEHDYTPGPVSEAGGPSTSTAQRTTPDPIMESREPGIETASNSVPYTGRQDTVLPNLGEPPIPFNTGRTNTTTAASNTHILGTYTIVSGDNPWKISARVFGNGKYAQQIVAANPGLNPAKLKIGQKIKIPAVAHATPRVPLEHAGTPPISSVAGTTPGLAVRTPGPVTTSSVAANPHQPQNTTAGRTHKIQVGDTLGAIASKYLGSSGPKTVKKLLAANPGINPRRLKIGDELKIPAP